MTARTRPVIGITCRLDPATSRYNVREFYADAVHAAGGLPVIVPLLPVADYIEPIIEHLDAICLSGSDSDIDPSRYGLEPRTHLGAVVPRRDETDQMLLAAAEERRMPVLGICFGVQSINVFRGGTLVQDIPSEVKNAVKHSQDDPQPRHCHSISISEQSLLAELAGSNKTWVNSYHHQSVDIVGRDLEPVAWAADGVIEAVINTRSDQFILGVQWHPEVGWKEDRFSQAIFNHFVAVARDQMEARQLSLAGTR